MDNPLRNGFCLGPWEVRPIEGQLIGPDGSVHLEPKVMDVLVCLAGNAGYVTERSDILNEVWGATAVSDEPLTRCIATLRRVLGDSQKEPRFIQTVPKRGYRLVADVTEPESNGEAGKGPGLRAALVLGATIAVLAAALYWFSVRSDGDSRDQVLIAVTPFTSSSENAEERFAAAGFSENLGALLGQTSTVNIVGPVSAMRPAEELAEIGTDYILSGKLDWNKEFISVRVELVDVSGNSLWSQTIDRPSSQVFDVQNTIVATVLRAAGTDEKDTGLAQLEFRRGGTDAETYRQYLRVRHQASLGAGFENLADARSALMDVIGRDPEFADPYIDLAVLYQTSAAHVQDRDSPYLDLAIAACQKAISLDPESVRAHAAQAMNYIGKMKWQQARESLDKAIEFSNGNSETEQISWAQLNLGHIDAAQKWAAQFVEFDPFNPMATGTYGTFMAFAGGDPDEALRHLRMTKELGFAQVSWGIGTVYWSQHDYEAAAEHWREGWSAWGFDGDLAAAIAAGAGDASQRTAAIKAIDDSVAAGRTDKSYLPWLYSYLYDADRVFEAAFELLDSNELNPTPFWYQNAGYLRRDPRYLELMGRMGLVDYWNTYEWPPNCVNRDGEYRCY